MRVALVSCVKRKALRPTAARDLYISPLFRAMRRYAEAHADRWYILSAEHGVLDPDAIVAPYERTLLTMKKDARRAWAERVTVDLATRIDPDDEVILLAGARYREHVEPWLRQRGCIVSIPLDGLSLGRQLQWLHRNAPMPSDVALSRFYELLQELRTLPGQELLLGQFPRGHRWPQRGVYFFLEPGETVIGSDEPRVVRVGTHAVSRGSRSTLRGRLRQHRGTKSGSGNHRGSIFRLHVGNALKSRLGIDLPTWGVKSSAARAIRMAEVEHEQRVSAHIGAMRVLWVDVPDEPGPESERSVIERGSVALLSNNLQPRHAASQEWLGHHSPREEIRRSGLWNLNYVQDAVDHTFLDVLERAVRRTATLSGT